jgi:hypothetical protein
MTPISLGNITYSQGLQLLAARKQALDSGHIQRMSKEAMAVSFPLRDIGADYIEKLAESGLLDSLKSGFGGMDDSTRNVLLSGLAGAGLGAGAGGASALLNGEEGAGWKALQGGLAGGAVGGGLGLAFNPDALGKALHFEKKPGLTSALPPDASKSRQIAAHIKSKSPAEQLNEINELQSTAESSMPEVVNYTAHGLNTLATGGAGAYVATKGVYDPHSVAENIRARLQNTGKNAINSSSFNSVFPMPVGSAGPRLPQHLSADEIRAMLPKSLIPGVTPGLLNTKLQSSMGATAAKEIIEASKVTGMRNALGKLRPGKLGLLGLLAGSWGVGSGIIRNHYRQGDANRNSAKDVLNALVMPDQTANTMQ